MITGGSEERRKFLDTLISQVDAEYLQQLIVYNKVLLQRNSFLKNEAFQANFDQQLLDVFDRQLIQPGQYIHAKRKQYGDMLIPLVQEFYRDISGKEERIRLEYISALNSGDFAELLRGSRQKDILSQRTNSGIPVSYTHLTLPTNREV